MKITFTINLDGNITTDVEGGDGVNCLEATEPYEEALADPGPDRQMKPEACGIASVSTENRLYL